MVIIQEYAQNGTKLRICDARCYNAKGKKCSCICGATNHGKGIDFAIQNASYILNELRKLQNEQVYLLSEIVECISHNNLFSEHKYLNQEV